MQKHHLKTLESSANSLTNMLFTRWSHWLKTFSLGIWCYFDPPPSEPRPEARTCATLPMAIADTSGPAWDLGHWGHHPRAQHGKGWSEGHSVCVPAKPATVEGGGGVEPHWLRVIPSEHRGFLIIWISTQVTNICVYKCILKIYI